MLIKRKLSVTLVIGSLVVLGLAATQPSAHREFKNLKVLPKNISHKALDKIMHQFNKDLGVKCGFCHARTKDDPPKMDFASDAKGEKEIARHMMKMTLKLNKKYFHVRNPVLGDSSSVVTCYTCHHGAAHPSASVK